MKTEEKSSGRRENKCRRIFGSWCCSLVRAAYKEPTTQSQFRPGEVAGRSLGAATLFWAAVKTPAMAAAGPQERQPPDTLRRQGAWSGAENQKCSEFLRGFDSFIIVRIHHIHMVLTLSPP
jgi:hypothetical protein